MNLEKHCHLYHAKFSTEKKIMNEIATCFQHGGKMNEIPEDKNMSPFPHCQ